MPPRQRRLVTAAMERRRKMCGAGDACKSSTGRKVRDPRKCSAAQIRKCHGAVKKHPCARRK
jgi:hypothetical protein